MPTRDGELNVLRGGLAAGLFQGQSRLGGAEKGLPAQPTVWIKPLPLSRPQVPSVR